MAEILTQAQIDQYRETGYLVLDKRIPADVMNAVRGESTRLSAPARGMTAPEGRADLDDGDTPARPRVRRVTQPHEQSRLLDTLMRSDWILAPVRDLIGPDVRLNGSELTVIPAGSGAAGEWRQDWAFHPQTNDDALTVGVLIDDAGGETGPLQVIPGTHRDPVHDHHRDGLFAGTVDIGAAGMDTRRAVALRGSAGAVTIHHARLLHGWGGNISDRELRVLFYEMTAADAVPLACTPGAALSWQEMNERILCGRQTSRPRLKEVPVLLPCPKPPTTGSADGARKPTGPRSFGAAEPAPS